MWKLFTWKITFRPQGFGNHSQTSNSVKSISRIHSNIGIFLSIQERFCCRFNLNERRRESFSITSINLKFVLLQNVEFHCNFSTISFLNSNESKLKGLFGKLPSEEQDMWCSEYRVDILSDIVHCAACFNSNIMNMRHTTSWILKLKLLFCGWLRPQALC